MTAFQKLVAAYKRLYRAVLNRSKFVYPIYSRQVARFGKQVLEQFIGLAKREALLAVTRERKAK